MRKLLIALTAVFGSGLAFGHAGEMENLKTSFPELSPVEASYFQQNDISVVAPSTATPGPVVRVSGPQQGDDAVINSLTDAQWDSILNSRPWEESVADEDPGISKELFSDYHTRYIAEGYVSFKTNPPIFTTESGKVFIITKYPEWLKEVGDTKICVEGYAKQQDDTSEFIIKKMLPPSALDDIAPPPSMEYLQRDPYIISHDSARYEMGNVNWNLAHSADGERLTDQYGNFVSVWQTGVVVKPELLETAYFVKKTALKPARYGNHGLLMFTFKPGGVVTADGQQARGIAVSVDAYHTDQTNMSYSPIAAFKGKYLIYYSIQTMERYTEFTMSGNEESMTLYPLGITRGQQLLDNAFRKATDNNMGEIYSLFYNSCANSVLSLINSVLDKGRKIKAGWLPEIIYRAKATFPDAAAALLLKKGVVGKPLPEVTGANYQHAYDF